MELLYEAVPDMNRRLWDKFMLDVGVNQTVAIYESTYGEIQKQGPSKTN